MAVIGGSTIIVFIELHTPKQLQSLSSIIVTTISLNYILPFLQFTLAVFTLETDYPLDNLRQTDDNMKWNGRNFAWTTRLTLSICCSVNFDGFCRWIIRHRRITVSSVKTAIMSTYSQVITHKMKMNNCVL